MGFKQGCHAMSYFNDFTDRPLHTFSIHQPFIARAAELAWPDALSCWQFSAL
jgi:hypothetical protein